MTEIPQDVLATARKLYGRTPISKAKLTEAIARAIMAERERCAAILRAMDEAYGWDENNDRPYLLAVDAIRSGN